MYASRVTPVQRMRGGDVGGNNIGRRNSSASPTIATACMLPTKGSSISSSASLTGLDSAANNYRHQRNGNSRGSLNLNKDGDYQVLRSEVDTARSRVHDERVDLAKKLDQLGEHHVRRKEYEDAMDAFTEALREKRSVFWNIGNCNIKNLPKSQSDIDNKKQENRVSKRKNKNSENGSSFSSSILSGVSNGHSGSHCPSSNSYTTNDEDSDNHSYIEHVRVHDATIDALVHTLRNIGNVHSLRGEQDEAMRYFTEVTTLRAQKLSREFESACQDADDASVETRSFLSGLGGGNSAFSAGTTTSNPGVATENTTAIALSTGGDENSALMSEINEDVRALDDLFRSISFRQGAKLNTHQSNPAEKRKSKSSSRKNKKHKRGRSGGATQCHRRLHSETHIAVDASDALFQRGSSTSVVSSPAHNTSSKPHRTPTSPASSTALGNGGHEMFLSAFTMGPPGSSVATQAMEKYRMILDLLVQEEHSKLRQHQEKMNSFALRIDLQQDSTMTHGRDASETKADLDLALDIYRHILLAYKEIPFSSKINVDLQTSISLASSSSSSQRQSLFSIASTESTTSTSGMSTASSTTSTSQKLSKRERRQEIAANIASVLICMGSVYYRLGNRREELDAYKRAKNVYARSFGENHVFVAGTRKNIGMVLAERGQYDLAQQQFEKALSIYIRQNKQLVDASVDGIPIAKEAEVNAEISDASLSKDVASVISCIGNVKNRVGELGAALTKYLQALQIYKTIYERQPERNGATEDSRNRVEALRDVTSTLKVIGMVHAKRGELSVAMEYFQEAMSLLRNFDFLEGDNSNDTNESGNQQKEIVSIIQETKASVITRIASIHLKKGELDEAMGSYREAYDLTVKTRGNTTNHPEIAGILHYIGGIYHKRGEYDEAMSCYQESIRIYHSTLGSDHPTVAGTLVMVGSIHYKRRHLDSAMMFYREALRLNRDAYGMHHPDVAPILKSIGTILTKKGEYHEAYDLFRDVLSVKVTVHGTDHPEVASAYKSLGNVHYKLGELGDAERQYRHALSIYRRSKGDDHPDTVSAKTTIEHLRYWMREREQQRRCEQQQDQRRQPGAGAADERSC